MAVNWVDIYFATVNGINPASCPPQLMSYGRAGVYNAIKQGDLDACLYHTDFLKTQQSINQFAQLFNPPLDTCMLAQAANLRRQLFVTNPQASRSVQPPRGSVRPRTTSAGPRTLLTGRSGGGLSRPQLLRCGSRPQQGAPSRTVVTRPRRRGAGP